MSQRAEGSFSVLAAARDQPGRDALIVDGAAWSWRALGERTRAAIDAARALPGVARWRPSDAPPRVALVARPEPDAVVALFALVELGLPAVLLHPRATAQERRAALAASGATLAFDDAFRGSTPARSSDGDAHDTPPDDERWLAVVFTSGTAGAPRPVVLSRAAFAFAARASEANLGFVDGDRWLLALPFAHVGGLAVLLRCLLARRAAVIAPVASTAALAEVIARDRVTLLSLVPTQLHRLLALDPPFRTPPFLRAVLLGGAAASRALLTRAAGRGVPVLATYGMTETCGQVATQRPGARPDDGSGIPPLPGVDLRAIEHDGCATIAVRAPSLFSGYLDGGTLRSAIDANGFFVTGDAGRIDERRHLHVLGRIDDMIVSGGEKVHPFEVESALAEIATACVFGREDTEWGEVVCAALVRPAGAPQPADAELSSALGGLAPFKRPRRVAWLDTLPLTPSGKLDRRAAAAAASGHLRPLGDRDDAPGSGRRR